MPLIVWILARKRKRAPARLRADRDDRDVAICCKQHMEPMLRPELCCADAGLGYGTARVEDTAMVR
jgi:hypothetical protein